MRNLHSELQAAVAVVRQQFRPLSLRTTARKIVQQYVSCFKVRSALSEATMSSLPVSRMTISRPFTHYGVDYAGPVMIREGKRRNAPYYEAYIAIFMCFATA